MKSWSRCTTKLLGCAASRVLEGLEGFGGRCGDFHSLGDTVWGGLGSRIFWAHNKIWDDTRAHNYVASTDITGSP